ATPRGIATRAQATFAASMSANPDLDEATANLQDAFRETGTWLIDQGARYAGGNHTERHFGAFVLADHGQRLLAAADEIPDTVRADADPDACIARLHRRLIDQFTATVSSFERKRYVNLGHEANKAANLNAYIGLMGSRVREEFDGTDWHLVASGDDATGTPIASPAYVITLDADSVVNANYARHLVGFLEAPGHESVAVAQTPYSAIPGASGAIELVAGATTDMQFIAHQGFTHYGATFWVGANAVLRKTALDSIGEMTTERGYPVPTFIQDRTVIEDTESTIDLAARGWSLHNEPHRLAYSATPPDFGTLVIQRRRWANGGLLIFPKLLRYAFQRHRGRPLELLIRTHYLLSPALSSIGMLALLVLPVSASYLSPWLVLSGIPYLLLYGRDLSLNGYRWADLPRVYSFNWLLVPVNIAGVGKSIQQGLTGKKIPFGRTPKVEGRTAAPAWAVASLVVLTLYLALAGGANLWQHNWMVAGFDTLTIAALLYGLLRFVGASAAWEDLGVSRRAATTANAIARRLSVPAGARNEDRRPS
ncbi:MAG: glycosyltransferase family 2 protein, partial [Thermomicrobiales bacterium]